MCYDQRRCSFRNGVVVPAELGHLSYIVVSTKRGKAMLRSCDYHNRWLHEGCLHIYPRASSICELHQNRLASAILSPDGSHLAYLGATKSGSSFEIVVRRLDQLEAKPLSGVDIPGVFGSAFSPDGSWIAYSADGKLKKIPAVRCLRLRAFSIKAGLRPV